MKPSVQAKGENICTAIVTIRGGLCLGLAVILLMLVSGCQTASGPPPADFAALSSQATKPDALVLHEGDVVRVTFPGAAALNGPAQTIRRDGSISIPPLGEIKAAGLTTKELEKAILATYGPQIQTKEVNVTLESSGFAVYVTGLVLRPGKVTAERPLTALEALMEAGGPDYTKANLKKVTVIRVENGRTERHVLNLRLVLDGKSGEQFKLKPADIVYVPEKFTWF